MVTKDLMVIKEKMVMKDQQGHMGLMDQEDLAVKLEE